MTDRPIEAPSMEHPVWSMTSLRETAVLATLLSIAIPLAAQTLGDSANTRRAEVEMLARELPKRHPAPFIHITQTQWDSAAQSLEQRLPSLTSNQALVGLFQLVALIGDAHTTIEPTPALDLHQYPFELYDFDDGLYVREADSAHARLVGGRVVRFGNASAAEAMARAATIVSHENDWWVRRWAPFWMAIPEIANGLGLTPDAGHLKLVVERNGRLDSAVIEPAGRFAHNLAGPTNWVTMRDASAPYWEQRPGSLFWWTADPADRVVYVSMRGIVPAPRSATNRVQWDSVFALCDSMAPARLVIDLRANQGGNGFFNRYPVQQILRRPNLDRPDRLFVVIGRKTFSAGQQFTNLLEAWTHATLVGEPSGQRPSQYGDHRPLELPTSHILVQISTVFHQAPNEFDTRTFVPPAIYTPLTSAEYRRGVDPAWQAILVPDTTTPLIQRVDRLIAADDSDAAWRALYATQTSVANRFRTFEADINSLGYQLLAHGNLSKALVVFRLNTRMYPRSANAFDSMGEALLAAGKRQDAIAAYHRAVEIDSTFAPSLAALQRLGVLGTAH
jgi:hypothetical protein